jgi:hypothetical protein
MKKEELEQKLEFNPILWKPEIAALSMLDWNIQ